MLYGSFGGRISCRVRVDVKIKIQSEPNCFVNQKGTITTAFVSHMISIKGDEKTSSFFQSTSITITAQISKDDATIMAHLYSILFPFLRCMQIAAEGENVFLLLPFSLSFSQVFLQILQPIESI